jgi:hypothetical protein
MQEEKLTLTPWTDHDEGEIIVLGSKYSGLCTGKCICIYQQSVDKQKAKSASERNQGEKLWAGCERMVISDYHKLMLIRFLSRVG